MSDRMEPPENYDIIPCDYCSIFGGTKYIADDDMECDEEFQDTDKCRFFNPKPVTCDACGKILSHDSKDLCKECQAQDDYRQALEWDIENSVDFGDEEE